MIMFMVQYIGPSNRDSSYLQYTGKVPMPHFHPYPRLCRRRRFKDVKKRGSANYIIYIKVQARPITQLATLHTYHTYHTLAIVVPN
jgi:hypothetical protein